MTTKELARSAIEKLVVKFNADKDLARFSEDDVCKNYILPLMRALGWDTESSEVMSQETFGGKRSDYGFYLGESPRFYVEAKKVTDPNMDSHIKQAITYSYLRDVTWAVLTNFKVFRLYSAEDADKENRHRPFLLNVESPDDYLTQFDDLWLLSKPSIQARELDKKGQTAGIIRKRQPVIKTLFIQLAEWRRKLMNNLFRMETERIEEALHQADNNIQRLFDRLIFIRTVEDREIENKVLIQLVNQYNPRKGPSLWNELPAQQAAGYL